MQWIIRQENPAERRVVEELTREAFWNQFAPGANEHYLLHVLRGSPGFIPALSCVAEVEGALAGHIAYSRSCVRAEDGQTWPTITFGPISVRPDMQGKGIGAALIRHTLACAADMGERAAIILGDPAYYRRVGFVGGRKYGIHLADGRYLQALHVCELRPGALDGVHGAFVEDPAFAVDEAAATAFDATFAPKQKGHSPMQDRFLELLELTEDEA